LIVKKITPKVLVQKMGATSLVKRILELNRGHISVEIDSTKSETLMSIEYQRNLFTLTLPANKNFFYKMVQFDLK